MFELFEPRAFALGMVALINPCGFALLPAYLGFFLGLDDADEGERRITALNRAQIVGLSLSIGFLAVFGLIGIVFAGALSTISQYLPWVTLIMGVGLVILGVAMLRGFQPLVKIPKLEKGTGSRSTFSMFLFGVSYAIASLSCTIGLFLSAVPTAGDFTFAERVGAFVSYGIGMGLLATVLTLAVAFGKKGIVGKMRSVLPKINLISAIILVVVGIYVMIYGYWSVRVFDDPRIFLEENNPGFLDRTSDTIVTNAELFQADLASWVNSVSTPFGWVFAAVNVTLIVWGFIARRNSKPASPNTPTGAAA